MHNASQFSKHKHKHTRNSKLSRILKPFLQFCHSITLSAVNQDRVYMNVLMLSSNGDLGITKMSVICSDICWEEWIIKFMIVFNF